MGQRCTDPRVVFAVEALTEILAADELLERDVRSSADRWLDTLSSEIRTNDPDSLWPD